MLNFVVINAKDLKKQLDKSIGLLSKKMLSTLKKTEELRAQFLINTKFVLKNIKVN